MIVYILMKQYLKQIGTPSVILDVYSTEKVAYHIAVNHNRNDASCFCYVDARDVHDKAQD